MNTNTWNSRYFYGFELTEQEIKDGYVSYGTLAKVFPHILNNDIMGNLESAGYYFEPIYPDYSEEIDSLNNELMIKEQEYSELYDKWSYVDYSDSYINAEKEIRELADMVDMLNKWDDSTTDTFEQVYSEIMDEVKAVLDNSEENIEDIKNRITELEDGTYDDIFQYYIVPESAVEIIREFTNDPIYHCEEMDLYLWGITHWGKSWNYVSTNCKIEF